MRGSQPKPKSLLARRGVAVPRLQQADDVLVEVRPPAGRRAMARDVARERRRLGAERRHRQIAGQQVVERRDVGRSLNRRVSAQREDAAAGPADVAEQQLQDRRRADDLHADRMLRESDRVADRRGAVRPRARGVAIGDLEERLARDAADALDHLRRVAREVPDELLIDVARMRAATRSRRGRPSSSDVVLPRRRVVRARVRLPAGEESVEILGPWKSSRTSSRRVRVGDDVVAEDAVVRRGRS